MTATNVVGTRKFSESGLFGPKPWHLRPRVGSAGPSSARIAFVGEAPGETEETQGVPFVGASGREFRMMLAQAGLSADDCFITNVFSIRPDENNLDEFCVTKAAQAALCAAPTPRADELGLRLPLGNGKYLHPELWTQVAELADRLRACAPNVVCAMGNTALWATAHTHKISAVRGTLLPGKGAAAGFKILPTFHPAAVLRDWRLRPIVILDLLKLAREASHADIRRPPRTLCIAETADELLRAVGAAPVLAVDVETARGQITRISFAGSPTFSCIVAFCSDRGENLHARETELGLWRAVATILADPTRTVIFQNGAYDLQYLWRAHHIPVLCKCEDTMIAHHALYPEVRKSLAFFGSIYTDEPAWKSLRLRAHSTTDKGEDT